MDPTVLIRPRTKLPRRGSEMTVSVYYVASDATDKNHDDTIFTLLQLGALCFARAFLLYFALCFVSHCPPRTQGTCSDPTPWGSSTIGQIFRSSLV